LAGLFGPLAIASTSSAFKLVKSESAQGQVVGYLAYEGSLSKELEENSLAPRGSVSMTASGDLRSQGIRVILHAATGSMGSFDDSTEPTLASVKQSISLALKLAERTQIKRVAVPLIGGGIFLNRLGITREKLAEEIISAAQESNADIEVIFVAYSDVETKEFRDQYQILQAQAEESNMIRKSWDFLLRLVNLKASPFFQRSRVVQGSIVDFKVHGASAIVNAANMELQFGGGLSGVIGQATGQAQAIDELNADLIQKLHQAK